LKFPSGPAPGFEDWNYLESETLQPPDSTRRISNVARPTLTVFLPAASLANGTAVILCPGGGFGWLSFDNEGTILVRWLNSLGVTAFVLKYRVMRTGDAGERDSAELATRSKTIIPLAVADGLRAVSLDRSRAGEWHLAKDRIGILGFSAGGHVAAAVAMHHNDASRPCISTRAEAMVWDAQDGPSLRFLDGSLSRLARRARIAEIFEVRRFVRSSRKQPTETVEDQ
jgi:acetyl esterase/lipase